jgi:AcrR family transcriptional regulator
MARPKKYTEEFRSRLLDRAGRIVHSKGLAALTTRALADASGATTSAIYSLFGSRRALLAALSARAFEGFGASQAEVTTTDDPLADLERLGLAYRDWAHRHRHLYAVMFGGALAGYGPRTSAMAECHRAIDPLTGAVVRAVAAGLLRGEVPSIVIAVWTVVHGFTALELGGMVPRAGARRREAAYLETLRAALRGWGQESANRD